MWLLDLMIPARAEDYKVYVVALDNVTVDRAETARPHQV
jgi:hypothetical protein